MTVIKIWSNFSYYRLGACFKTYKNSRLLKTLFFLIRNKTIFRFYHINSFFQISKKYKYVNKVLYNEAKTIKFELFIRMRKHNFNKIPPHL